jgi:hypothetical protein
VASFIETTLPSRPEYLDSLNLFSAKDAKDAKRILGGGFGVFSGKIFNLDQKR